MPEGVYYAAVVPMDVDGNCIMPDLASVEEDIIGYQSPYNRLKKVTGLEWNETRANWDAKANFTENDMYTINLYTVSRDGSKAEDFHFYKSFEVSGSVHASDFRNAFAAETDYAFTVIANVGLEYQMNLLAFENDPPFFKIDSKILCGVWAVRIQCCIRQLVVVADGCADSSQKFKCAKRLGNVIVSTCVQS